jgi:hypothetical protein
VLEVISETIKVLALIFLFSILLSVLVLFRLSTSSLWLSGACVLQLVSEIVVLLEVIIFIDHLDLNIRTITIFFLSVLVLLRLSSCLLRFSSFCVSLEFSASELLLELFDVEVNIVFISDDDS